MKKQLYSFKEAAEVIGVNSITISRWVREGKIAVVYLPVSTRPLISQEEVNRIMTPVSEKPDRV